MCQISAILDQKNKRSQVLTSTDTEKCLMTSYSHHINAKCTMLSVRENTAEKTTYRCMFLIMLHGKKRSKSLCMIKISNLVPRASVGFPQKASRQADTPGKRRSDLANFVWHKLMFSASQFRQESRCKFS